MTPSSTFLRQPDPHHYTPVREVHPDGIVFSGYKCQICGVEASHEIICMQGGGSPDGPKLVVRAMTKWEEYAAAAKRIAGMAAPFADAAPARK
jgi:aromatic ring hydroxylase